MLSRIEIKNFRRLSQVEIDLTSATVLVGPNSCGKTSVLHAVQLACAALAFGASRGKVGVGADGWLTLISNNALRDDQSFLPTTRWIELFSDADSERDIEISLFLSDDHAIDRAIVRLHAGRAEALRLTVMVKAADGKILRQVIDGAAGRKAWGKKVKNVGGLKAEAGILSTLRDQLPRAVFVPAFYGVVREEQYLARGAVEALLQAGQQGHVVRNLLMRLPSLEDVNAFLPRAGIDARLARCTSQHETETVRFLEVLFRDRNGNLELSSAGTGLTSLLALFAAIQLYPSSRSGGGPMLFLLDEPEAHLHPRLQGDSAGTLMDMVTAAGNQLLCATHSVEMINRFGRDPRATVLRIDSNQAAGTGAVRILRSEDDLLDELSNWCDLSPFAKLNLLATRRVLFHEGPSDYEILVACARLYLGSDPTKLARFRSFTPVQLSGTGNLGAKEVLKRALLPMARQMPAGESFRVVRILDRDYNRRPQWDVTADPATRYEELDVVWSKHSIESLFIDPECLASWLDAALNTVPRIDRARLVALATEAISCADRDTALHANALAQLAPKLVTGKRDADIARAIQLADEQVRKEPAVFQRGHDRSAQVLGHIRNALLQQASTKDLAKAIRRDVAHIVQYSPLRSNLLLPPNLIPDEIRRLLDHMAAP